MNIGIFTDAYYPNVSGMVTSTRMLKEELIKLGHNVTIITVKVPGFDEAMPNVIRIPSIIFRPLPDHRIGSLYSHDAMKKIKSLNLDIIHTQTEFSIGIFGRIVAKTLDIPVVHTYHTMYEDYVHYITKGIMKKYVKTIAKKYSNVYCKTCDGVIVPTDKTKTALENYGYNKQAYVIPTGIDLSKFDRSQYKREDILKLKKEFDIDMNDPVICYIGRIAKEKSIDVIIKQMSYVVKKIPQAKFLIVGDGPEREALEQLGRDIGISNALRFTGLQPWDQIGIFYQLGDIFVSASITETQGLTLVEAMASELLVIAKYDSNLDGFITDKQNGRVFYNDNELAPLLIECLIDKIKSQKTIDNAYNDIQKMSARYFGERIDAIYKEIIIKKKELVK